ncbi:MAG TPA: hypothetical protein VG713_22095, partial [Pirellulales bacterium]|nr:hypothetical protein [Pirellulales bacterium]
MSEFPATWRSSNEPLSPLKVAVSGAAGQIGYGLVFRIAAGGLFGSEQPVSLSLLEAPEAIRDLEGITLELKDCAYPLLHELRLSAEPEQAFSDVDWIILLAGKSLNYDGTSRHDLLHINGPLYEAHGRAINIAAPRSRVLVVAEPCNTMCLVAMSQAPNVPAERWFALNRLDRMRATAMIAEKAGVPVQEV